MTSARLVLLLLCACAAPVFAQNGDFTACNADLQAVPASEQNSEIYPGSSIACALVLQYGSSQPADASPESDCALLAEHLQRGSEGVSPALSTFVDHTPQEFAPQIMASCTVLVPGESCFTVLSRYYGESAPDLNSCTGIEIGYVSRLLTAGSLALNQSSIDADRLAPLGAPAPGPETSEIVVVVQPPTPGGDFLPVPGQDGIGGH